MNNIIYLRGVPTPKYRAQRLMQDKDPDLMVNMVNSNMGHIMRSKAKAEYHRIQEEKKAAEERAREEERENLLTILGHIAVYSLMALMVVVAL